MEDEILCVQTYACKMAFYVAQLGHLMIKAGGRDIRAKYADSYCRNYCLSKKPWPIFL